MLWNDRVFAAVPVAPVWLGLTLALFLLLLFLSLMWLTGLLGEFMASDIRVWESRDARMGETSRDLLSTRAPVRGRIPGDAPRRRRSEHSACDS